MAVDGEATLRVRITVPEGVVAAKPMPKAGWDLETTSGAYAKTYDYHGPISEGVKEIVWTGKLEDAHYDEFVFRARITDGICAGGCGLLPHGSGMRKWRKCLGADPGGRTVAR